MSTFKGPVVGLVREVKTRLESLAHAGSGLEQVLDGGKVILQGVVQRRAVHG